MKTIANVRALGMLASTLLTVAACDSTTKPKQLQPVAMQLAGSRSASVPSAASGPLEITSLRLVVGAASLGSGDQFGCVDCQGNTEDRSVTPKLLDVPLGGGTVLVATEQVGPGRYSQAEVLVESPTSATLASAPDWPANATIEIDGRFNGTPFRLPLTIIGSFRETLNPPVEVSATTPPSAVAVTITLPVASWFTSNGAVLDPSNPAQRATIETNARNSFQPLEQPGPSEGGG